MSVVFSSIIPIILIILLGNVLRHKNFIAKDFWESNDKLVYFILFPALIITKVYAINFGNIDVMRLLFFIVLFFIVTALLSIFVFKITKANKRQFSSIYQANTRFNSYIYFAISSQLWGDEGLALSALIAGISIPIVNVTSIASFSFDGNKFSPQKIIVSIIKNPFIIATIIGFLANNFNYLLPQVIFNTFETLAKATLPLALLSVGASLSVKSLLQKNNSSTVKILSLSSASRLLIVPLIALLLTQLLQISGGLQQSLVLFSTIPTATSAYILSKQMNGDSNLMAGIITLQTIISGFSLMAWIIILIRL